MKTFKKIFLVKTFIMMMAMQSANAGYGDAIKEIFMKGSINGQSMFMVLGFEKANKIFKKSMKEAIGIEELQKIGHSVVELKDDFKPIYNGGDNDLVEHVGKAAKMSKKFAKEIFKGPWRSLKKIPSAYEVSFDAAREAYYESGNEALGSLKYAGHAVWANIKGSYYLVIEAPAKIAFNTFAAVAAIPLAIGYDLSRTAINLTLGVGGLVVNISAFLVNALYEGSKGILTSLYAGLSTGVAIVATTTASGVVSTYLGAKWLIRRPLYWLNPYRVTLKTEISMDRIEELSELFSQGFAKDILDKLQVKNFKGKNNGDDLSRKIILYAKNNLKSKPQKALVVDLSITKKKIKIYAYIDFKHMKRLKRIFKSEGMSKKEIKDNLQKLLQQYILKTMEGLL